MKRVLFGLTLAAIASANFAYAADPPTMVWDATYDSGNDDIAWAIAVDAQGSVYAAGTIDNRVVSNMENLDWLVIKYDAHGDTMWTRTWGFDTGNDQTRSIAADESGNVYVAGWFDNGTDLDLRFVKYDTNGNLLWEKTRDSGGDDWGNAVTVDNAGDVYLTGREGPGIWPDQIYYAKYDSEGSLIWEKYYDVVDHGEGGFGIVVDDEGFIYIHAAIFTGIPGDGYDLLTLKCDERGDTIWSRGFDTGRGDYLDYNTIAVDDAGNVYTCGWIQNDATPSTIDWFVHKYDSEGTLQWNKIIDTGYDEGAQDITVDSEGYIYVTGPFGPDCVTHKLDSGGRVIWEATYEASHGHGIAVDDSGYIYIGGNTYNGIDEDCLIIKYTQQVVGAEDPKPSPTTVTLRVANNLTNTPTVNYSIPSGYEASLTFYTADGRKLESHLLDPAQSAFTWADPNASSGLYFARLTTKNAQLTARVLLIR